MNRWFSAVLRNETKFNVRLRLGYEYGRFRLIDVYMFKSEWVDIAPQAEQEVLKLRFATGLFTIGRCTWDVEGIMTFPAGDFASWQLDAIHGNPPPEGGYPDPHGGLRAAIRDNPDPSLLSGVEQLYSGHTIHRMSTGEDWLKFPLGEEDDEGRVVITVRPGEIEFRSPSRQQTFPWRVTGMTHTSDDNPSEPHFRPTHTRPPA